MERLDHKLDCKSCGTIYLKIPEDVVSHRYIARHADNSLVIGENWRGILTAKVDKMECLK
jgi:hypothetical protein